MKDRLVIVVSRCCVDLIVAGYRHYSNYYYFDYYSHSDWQRGRGVLVLAAICTPIQEATGGCCYIPHRRRRSGGGRRGVDGGKEDGAGGTSSKWDSDDSSEKSEESVDVGEATDG